MDKIEKAREEDSEYYQVWKEELQKRIEEVRQGKGNLVSTKVAVSEIRKKISK